MKTATKKVTEETIENFNNAVELSQKTADMFLASSVQSMEISNNYFQSVVKAGLDAQIAGINITRSYFEGLAEVQKSWLNLYAANGEKSIKWFGEASANFKETINNYAENIENLTAQTQAKSAAK